MNILNSKTILLIISLGIAMFLWGSPWQSQDGPNHNQVAVILKRLDHSPTERQYYQSNLGAFHTNQLYPLLYRLSPDGLPIKVYEKCFVGFFLILLLWTYYAFLKTWSPQSAALWPLILPMLFHLLFIQGMYNFLASVPLTLLGLIFLKRSLENSWLSNFLLFTFFNYLAFLAHPFPAFIFLTCLFLLNLFRLNRTGLRLIPCWGVVLAFFTLGFIVPLFGASPESGTMGFIFKPPWELLGGLFAFNFPGYSVLQLAFLAPFFLYLLLIAYQSIRKSPWSDKIFWLSFLAIYFIFPNEGKGGAHLNLRFLPYVWLFLPLGLRPDLLKARWGALLSLGTALYLGVVISYQMTQTDLLTQRVQKVFQKLPAHASLYPINFNVHGPGLNYTAWMHLWANIPEAKVVFSPYLFAKLKLMPLSLRPQESGEFPATEEDYAKEAHKNLPCHNGKCPEERKSAWEKIHQTAGHYDYWWVFDAPQDFLETLNTDPKLSLVEQDGEISLWHYHRPNPEK